MSNEELNEFKVSAIFQNRLSQALKGEKGSNVELAKQIGVSKDIMIKASNAGIIPSTRSLIKIADYVEESIDYLIGLTNKSVSAKSLDSINFQDRIKDLIIENHTKKGTVAAATGISRSLFNSWEKNNYIPSIEILFQLSKYFSVSIDYLLARTDTKTYDNKKKQVSL